MIVHITAGRQAEALAKRRAAHGNASLCDLGYCSVGIDEGWEGCGAGVNGTQHGPGGRPTVAGTFPDMAGLVGRVHALGLKAGWYLNGCKCGEKTALPINYEGDIAALDQFGFDGVKFDGCGAQRNLTLYVRPGVALDPCCRAHCQACFCRACRARRAGTAPPRLAQRRGAARKPLLYPQPPPVPARTRPAHVRHPMRRRYHTHARRAVRCGGGTGLWAGTPN